VGAGAVAAGSADATGGTVGDVAGDVSVGWE